jgi:predicted metalloprotease with PDZ domain
VLGKSKRVPGGLTLALVSQLFCAGGLRAQNTPVLPIKIAVDATHAPQKILHATLEIPASAGPLTLYYPRWLPADHSPDGPIANVAGIKVHAGGKPVAWHQDLEDMYTFHVDVPPATNSVTVDLDFLLSLPGPVLDFAASGSSKLVILMWNEVLLYPAGRAGSEIMFEPSVRLPKGWKFHTALPIASQSDDTIRFERANLDLLVDSPVQSGQYSRVIELTPGEKVSHEIDMVADDPWALEMPAAFVEGYKKLIAEAEALFQSHHYRNYHFLLTLSNNTIRLGQEHHESSDDRVAERSFLDPNRRVGVSGLFPHEYTHSWNGKYRRPAGLATADYQQPMKGDLLWVYEGLTSYLGNTVLSARSGLVTPSQSRESLAALASAMDHRAGRTWRSLQNTSNAAQILYFAYPEWASYRRGTDFYTESVLLWLEVDVTIRKLTQGRRSMNDFCRSFYAGPDGAPTVKTYTFDDLVSALNDVAAYDWRSFLRERLDSTEPHAPLGGVTGGGWRLVYSDEPNTMVRSREEGSGGTGDLTTSLGLVVRGDGRIQDSIPGMPAFAAGLSPYMRIVGVNGRQFSLELLNEAVRDAKSNPAAIAIMVASDTGILETHEINYHDGMRFPHLEQIPGTTDYVDEILKPLTGK